MTDTTPAMIVSGVPYAVTGVEGRTPTSLEEFEGQVTIHTHGPTGDHDVTGSGELAHDGTVKLHEKHDHGTGRDVRTWTVSPAPDGDGFDAEA